MCPSHKEVIEANNKSFAEADAYDDRESTRAYSKVFAKTLLEPRIEYGGKYGDFELPDSGINQDIIKGDNLNGQMVLDFACGTGMVARNLVPHMKNKAKLVGIDINQVFLDKFDAVVKPLGDKYGVEVNSYNVDILDQNLCCEIDKFDQFFDVIYCTISYHHLHNYEAVTAKLATFLKPQGRLYIIDFYNIDVEDDGCGRGSPSIAVQHMGGLRKNSLIKTLTNAGLREIKVEQLCSVKSWHVEQFIRNHCSRQIREKLDAGELPSKRTVEGLVYGITSEFVLAFGKK